MKAIQKFMEAFKKLMPSFEIILFHKYIENFNCKFKIEF